MTWMALGEVLRPGSGAEPEPRRPGRPSALVKAVVPLAAGHDEAVEQPLVVQVLPLAGARAVIRDSGRVAGTRTSRQHQRENQARSKQAAGTGKS